MTTDFSALGVPAPLVSVLAAEGKTQAFPIQADTLPDSLAGRDVLGHADLIVLRETKAWLAAAIDFVADRGLRSVYLWSFSATDAQRDRTGEVLSFAEAMPAVREAFARGAARGVNVRTLHIPHCVLGDDAHRGMDPTAEPVRVVTPDAVFDLRDSPLSPSVRVASCEGCWRANACKGARRDYLEVHGPQEILDAASRFAPPEIS